MPAELLPELTGDSKNKLTMAEIAAQWIESLRTTRKKSTIVKYAGQLRNYILPFLGHIIIGEITSKDIVVFSQWLLTNGRIVPHRRSNTAEKRIEAERSIERRGALFPRTVINILAELKSIRKFAVLRGLTVRFDPSCVEMPKADCADYKDSKVLSIVEQKKLLRYLKVSVSTKQENNKEHNENRKDKQDALTNLGILLSLTTGIRLGELCALKWSDFSLEDGEFQIQRTMQRLPISLTVTRSAALVATTPDIVKDVEETAAKRIGAKTIVEIGAPKSRYSVRTIPIPKVLMEYIERAYAAAGTATQAGSRGTEVSKVSKVSETGAFFLTGQSGSFVEPRTMENRFKAVLRKCGIRDINFHALRHSFATRCVELGFDVKTLSEILGHANVTITMNKYVHPSMNLKRENMNRLGEMMLFI